MTEACADHRLDRMLRGVANLFDLVFPGRVRAIYVDGSHADGTAVAASDLDLKIIFADCFCDGERERAARLAERCGALAAVELDASVEDEETLAAGITPMLKFGARLVCGEEIRDALPLMPIAAWTHERINAAYWLMVRVFDRPVPVMAPLDYPDPADPFLGYANRTVSLPDGTVVASTRNLIRVTGWIATARLALEAGQYVERKRDCHRLYRQWIGDEWSALLEEIYAQCRGAWGYLIPGDAAARTELRAICARILAFENDFLTRYKRFLLAELRAPGQFAESRAAWVLARVPICDAEIIEAFAARATVVLDD